jgi:hypothetical protein
VGNFAVNLESALQERGVEVETVQTLQHQNSFDCVLVQYGWELFDDSAVMEYCRKSPIPVFLFAHYGAEAFDSVAAGFLTVSEGIVSGVSTPVLDLAHPGWAPEALAGRQELKRRFKLPDIPVVGSSGFLMYTKEYPKVLERLLPHAASEGFFVDLVTSTWFRGSPGLMEELESLRTRFGDHFRYAEEYIQQAELNLRLQACDLLWCWTRTPSSPYGSGSISDQYGSGTRLVAPMKQQFSHVLGRANTVTCPDSVEGLVGTLVDQVRQRNFSRHDPAPLSWRECARRVESFLAAACG